MTSGAAIRCRQREICHHTRVLYACMTIGSYTNSKLYVQLFAMESKVQELEFLKKRFSVSVGPQSQSPGPSGGSNMCTLIPVPVTVARRTYCYNVLLVQCTDLDLKIHVARMTGGWKSSRQAGNKFYVPPLLLVLRNSYADLIGGHREGMPVSLHSSFVIMVQYYCTTP
jgi:hypothetical protein